MILILSSEKDYTLPDGHEIQDFIDKGGYGKVFIVEDEGDILAQKEIKTLQEW